MTDTLQQIEAELARKREEISAIQATIAGLEAAIGELEIAAKVVRNLSPQQFTRQLTPSAVLDSGTDTPSAPTIFDNGHGGAFAGKTMKQCAAIVLAERGPMHFKEVALESLRRGYRSGKDSDQDRLVQSFWATISRTEEFESIGKGLYRIKPKEETAVVE